MSVRRYIGIVAVIIAGHRQHEAAGFHREMCHSLLLQTQPPIRTALPQVIFLMSQWVSRGKLLHPQRAAVKLTLGLLVCLARSAEKMLDLKI